jgi:hypothetical protein
MTDGPRAEMRTSTTTFARDELPCSSYLDREMNLSRQRASRLGASAEQR